jgi:hypothetical protein
MSGIRLSNMCKIRYMLADINYTYCIWKDECQSYFFVTAIVILYRRCIRLLDLPHMWFLNHDSNQKDVRGCDDCQRTAWRKYILLIFRNSSTYGHSQLKTGHPVRSAIHKQLNGRLVLRWVTTWESLLLYVLRFFLLPSVCSWRIRQHRLVGSSFAGC